MLTDRAAPWAEPVLLTAEDLARMPDDAWRYELVHGRLVRMPPAGFDHGSIALDLATAVNTFVREHDLGRVVAAETGFLVSRPGEPDTVLAPDMAFVSSSRIPPAGSREGGAFARLAPDLVAEIASPGQSRRSLNAKARTWIDCGVRLVWVLWPDSQQIDVWEAGRQDPVKTLERDARLDGGDVLPGFSLQLSRLWP